MIDCSYPGLSKTEKRMFPQSASQHEWNGGARMHIGNNIAHKESLARTFSFQEYLGSLMTCPGRSLYKKAAVNANGIKQLQPIYKGKIQK